MKKLLIVACLIFLVGTVGLIVSCDKIQGPYMKVTDISDCPVPTFPDFPAPVKNVLVEEFTGHLCVYCPTGADYIRQIQQMSYGSRVIVLSIHASNMADPEVGNFNLDLRAESHGEELYSDFQIVGEPSAMFNREKLDGTNMVYATPSTWQAKVEQALAETPTLSMQIINNYDAATRKLCTHVRTEFLTASSQTLKIAVFIAEDSIVGYQKNNNSSIGTTPEITDYVFMDVMRDEFVGTFGETFTNGGVAQDSTVTRTYKKILNTAWVAKNCKIIAYVYDVNTEAILQVVEAKVIE